MKTILLAALLAAVPAAAQEAAPPAQPQQQPAAMKHYPQIMQVMKNLSVLMERGAEIPAERMDALAPELAKFDAKVKAALGDRLLAEIAAREKAIEDKARAESALSALRTFRAELQVYYGENGARYPASPAELAPARLPAVPELYLPGHQRTDKVSVIDSKKYDKDLPKAVKDTGGWLYFSDPGSEHYGLLILDCSHAGPDGIKFSEY